MLSKLLTVAAAVGTVAAQRPTDTPICDYYTTALLKENTAENQKTLLTLVVNTAIIGNYTQPNVGIAVPGILAPGDVNGTAVDLAPYFTGGLASTNRGGMAGRSVNFLDGGGAAPLMNNTLPTEGSNQYTLVTHLYSYFGALLGCTQLGNEGFPAYEGSPSQADVHKFMNLNNAEVTYFISQVAMSAASFGVAQEDLAVVGAALTSTFGERCAPPAVVVPTQPAAAQSICVAQDCPLAANASCASYANVTDPAVVPSNSSTGGGSSPSPSGTSGGSPAPTTAGGAPISTQSTASAATVGLSFAAVAGGLAALFL